jgi:uncharacterized membrane protein YjjP (DUF1212 family)
MKECLKGCFKLYLAYMAAGAAAIPAGMAYAFIAMNGQAKWYDAAIAIFAGFLLAHHAFTYVSKKLKC